MESQYKTVKLMGLRAEGGWLCVDSIYYDSTDPFFAEYKFIPRDIRELVQSYYDGTSDVKQISFHNTIFDPSAFIAIKCYIE